MLFGVDTSGKIGQGNLYLSVVEYKQTDIMEKLREKVSKRHMALASRRRIKATDLKESELKWFVDNFLLKYSASILSISSFSALRKEMLNVKDWKFKTLASSIYFSSKNLIRNNDVLLIDRDYSENVMKSILAYTRTLFEKLDRKNVIVEVGTSFNEVIAIADIVAGCAKRKQVDCKKLKPKDLAEILRSLR